MPDDISGMTGEFLGRLVSAVETWRNDEKLMGPTQDDVAEMNEARYGCHTCKDTGVDVPSLGTACTDCSHCYKNNHPIGLSGCVRCNSRGCVSSVMTRHGWSCRVCMCVPEHDVSWWGKFLHRDVPKNKIWRIEPWPCTMCRDHDNHGPGPFNLTGVRYHRPSTNTTEIARSVDPGLCMECLANNFPDGQCHCLDSISWFERDPDDRPVDPHGTFWR